MKIGDRVTATNINVEPNIVIKGTVIDICGASMIEVKQDDGIITHRGY